MADDDADSYDYTHEINVLTLHRSIVKLTRVQNLLNPSCLCSPLAAN